MRDGMRPNSQSRVPGVNTRATKWPSMRVGRSSASDSQTMPPSPSLSERLQALCEHRLRALCLPGAPPACRERGETRCRQAGRSRHVAHQKTADGAAPQAPELAARSSKGSQSDGRRRGAPGAQGGHELELSQRWLWEPWTHMTTKRSSRDSVEHVATQERRRASVGHEVGDRQRRVREARTQPPVKVEDELSVGVLRTPPRIPKPAGGRSRCRRR
jgi:hypothetical protein